VVLDVTTRAQIITTLVAAINAQLPDSVRAYDLDDLPGERPDTYVEITLSRRPIDESRRADGSLSFVGYRLGTRVVARYATSARAAQGRCSAALDFVSMTFPDGATAVIEFETEDDVAPDDGWFSALTDWTFSI
jgi:hypothetical protein